CDPDVVDTAGLAHDLGHPPFGHNGEDALDEVAAACGGGGGEAQTVRPLAPPAAKVGRGPPRPVGPSPAPASPAATRHTAAPRGPGTRKFGVYDDDRTVFDWLRTATPAGDDADPPAPDGRPRRCLEAQVMDWSDDVAYSVHDVEDGITSGHVRLAVLLNDAEE